MIKEYVYNLLQENEDELERFQQQMKFLLGELEKGTDTLEQIQRDRNRDENIFSPRAAKQNASIDLDKIKAEVDRIKQEMEFVREKIETCMKKKSEYEVLLQEVEKPQEEILPEKVEDNEINLHSQESSAADQVSVEDCECPLCEKKEEKTQPAKTEEAETPEDPEERNFPADEIEEAVKQSIERMNAEAAASSEPVDLPEILSEKTILLLKELYQSAEISLAFLNGNRNKCKTELQKMKSKIKNHLAEIENA